MNNRCKATIVVGESTIIIEGSEDFVSVQVEKYTNASKQERGTERLIEDREASARDLVAEKQPKGHHEIVAVLAFHLAQAGLEEFTEVDIRKAYLQAGVRPPKVVAQAIRDARSKSDYIESGKKRGSYRLSPHGDRTVRYDLPR